MSSAPLPGPESASPAEQLFADYLVCTERSDAPDFESFCRRHPAHSTELRRLKSEWDRQRSLAERAGLGSKVRTSFTEELLSVYGVGVDPAVSLGGDAPGPDSGPSSELLNRLRAHAPANSRYRLLGEVARGGMGAVLKIWDEDLRRTLAMKVVLGKDDSATPGSTPPVDTRTLGRFLEEAQVTGQLDHPGIVPVHELGLGSDGRVFFTMRLVKGEDLRTIYEHVATGHDGWNETRALSVLLKVCEAMSYAHDKGVVHRDLKPANVMVGKYGEVYVMDWGLARVLGQADRHDVRLRPASPAGPAVETERSEERAGTPFSPLVTMDGDVMGTPAYMPPEQARGEVEQVGPHSDVYAVGAMLYHLLTGEMPFVPKGERPSAHVVLMRVLSGPPMSIVEVVPRVPAELVAICEKAMERDISPRYGDMTALAGDLRAYLERRVVKAYESGTWAEARKWVQRNKPLAASLAPAIAIAIMGLVWVSAKNSEVLAANVDLAEAKKVAEDNALLASRRAEDAAEQSRLAKASEARASEKEHEATQKANDVLSLSAIQDLKDLEDRADTLWPAHPENVPKYDAWLKDAGILIEGRPADPARGLKAKVSLVEHEAKLAEIRRQAMDRTAEQIEADRRASPSYAEWEKSCAELQWIRRMLGEQPWPSEEEVEAAVAKERLPAEAQALNDLAWPLVDIDPAKIVYGSEVRGLILAKRAVAAAKEPERAAIRDTFGWAQYRCGHFDEAFAEEQRAVDGAQGKQKEDLAVSLEKMQQQIALWQGAELRTKQSERASTLATRASELGRSVDERRTYEFEDSEARWWYTQLWNLVANLKAFTDESTDGLFSRGTSEKHGWGIVKRAEFARTIAERSVSGVEAKCRWDEAIAAIAKNPNYGGVAMVPQMGLLPIGEDPDSHLWEFAHLQTGEAAQRGIDGKLILREEMGLVFVLIPSGTFWMGAQSVDQVGRNYDPLAGNAESPVHEVTLSPFLLSKFEMTQSQWQSSTAHNPSYYQPRISVSFTLLHPVEQVNWVECQTVMNRLCLDLPSEAQWEYGARGGTSTAWWTGQVRESLRGRVNIADQTAKRAGAPWADEINDWPDLDDGGVVHTEVGRFAANAFGLHEVAGNLWEWCVDGTADYDWKAVHDPVAPWRASPIRSLRGGAFDTSAKFARSSHRSSAPPGATNYDLGLRPSRVVTP